MAASGRRMEGREAWVMRVTPTLMISDVKGFVSFLRMSGGFSPDSRPGVESMTALESAYR